MTIILRDDGANGPPSPTAAPASSTLTIPRQQQQYTLDGNAGKTAHYMGPASEQDGFLLDTFRSAIINDQDEVDANIIQVYRGTHPLDKFPVHFLVLEDEFPSYTNQSMQNASEKIEALVGTLGPDLVRLYFHYVHPVYPILSKTRFLRHYATARTTALPASLRGAVYALASVFWNDRPGTRGSLGFEQHELVALAYESLRRELEAPNLAKLQACLLLLHIQPPDVDSVETPSTWTSTAQATACAQMIGLHRDPEAWHIPAWEKALRKKLWWAVFATDAWSSVCHGNPLHVHAGSFDTAPLHMEHLRIDEDVPEDLLHLVEPEDTRFQIAVAVRYLETIRISQSLHELLAVSYQIKPAQDSSSDSISKELRLQTVQQQLQDWHEILPRCLEADKGVSWANDNNPLHISYHATKVLLWRALMHPATAKAKVDDNSSLQRWFATALAEFEDFVNFFAGLDVTCLHGFIPRHTRSQLILCGNFLIYLFLLARKQADVCKAYQLLEDFQGSLLRLEAPSSRYLASSSRTVLFLKPVAFRIHSFFSQAADIMRQKYASPST